jgi:long-chain acyl-CoA synthetase
VTTLPLRHTVLPEIVGHEPVPVAPRSLDPLDPQRSEPNAQEPNSLERPWLARYPLGVPREFAPQSAPAWSLLRRAAEAHPDRLACRYYEQTRTYAELWADSARTARLLVQAGVRPGDRVGVLLPNCPEFLSTLHGIWLAGASAVALSPLMVAGEVSDLLAATGCRHVVALDVLAPLVRNATHQPEHTFYVTLNDRLPYWQRLPYVFARWARLGVWSPIGGDDRESWLDPSKCDADFEPIDVDPAAAAFILPTGGTTGTPKAVVLSHANLVANASQLTQWCGPRKGKDTVLAILPFFHAYGLSTGAMTSIASGATIVMHHRFVPRIVHQLLEQHEPIMFPAVPRVLVAMNEYLRTRPIARRCVQYVVSGGAPLDPAVAEEFERHTGARVVEGYGLSEASPVTHTGPLDDTARPGTIGLPLPGTDARIVDPETGTRTLPPGEVGELVVRGPQVFSGYWNNPEATAATIDEEGWLHTGDLATMDEDGFFRIVDRIKDLIIVAGFNVYPTDVESVLRGCPGVEDVAVVGVPCEKNGEAVRAIVVPVRGSGLTAKQVIAFAAEHLAKHKRPSRVELADDLPRNFLGKVLRRDLREGTRDREPQ